MERYSEYKDSGVKWLGEIPSHWEVKRLGSFFFERKEKVSDKDYAPLSVTKQGIFPQLENVAKTNDGDNRKLVKEGDFVINSRSDRKGSSGVSGLDGSVSLINIVLQPRKVLFGPFCNYILKSYGFIEENYRNGRGIVADLWTTRYDEMKMIKVAMPSFEEQKNISSYLDAATSKIDKAIAMQQKMIDLLNERKQIIIQNAVTKGLDENVEMKDSGVEWIGMIPKHWEILKLKRCASIKTGTTPPTNERKYFDGGRISWFTPGDLNDLHLKFASKTITQKAIDDKVGRLFPAKTIYFVGIGATVAKVSACDFAASSNQQINAIICNESLDYIFATYVLKSEQEFIRNMANYVTLPIINQSDTGLIDMIVPPKSEQQAIVAYLGKEMQRFDSAISNCQRQITLLQERKQIIINEVVTGKVKVS